MPGGECFPSRCGLIPQPLWIENEWPLFTLHGGAENDGFEAIFVLRAHAAKKRNDGVGLFAVIRRDCNNHRHELGSPSPPHLPATSLTFA